MHLILNLRLKHVHTQMLERGGHEYKLQHELHLTCCSGLPPASSLFTDSEASSEAEEEKAAVSGHASAHMVPSCSDAAMVHSSRSTLQHQQAPGANAAGRHALKLASESEVQQ